MKLLTSPAYLITLVSALSINLYGDYYCNDLIYSLDCSDYYDTCVTQGVWWNSYQIPQDTGNNCDAFATGGLWNVWFMGFSECGVEQGLLLGGGCGDNTGCQQTLDFDTRQWEPACSIGCFETFSPTGVDGGHPPRKN
jgi:hypothetical protein